MTDSEMLDWLERAANQKGGILLHDGTESGRLGLGLSKLGRSLRKAILDASPIPKKERSIGKSSIQTESQK